MLFLQTGDCSVRLRIKVDQEWLKIVWETMSLNFRILIYSKVNAVLL